MTTPKAMAGLGALFYLAWSLLHLQSALAVFHLAAGMAPGAERARVQQDAWNLMFFTVVVFVTALTLSWRNSRLGYWINLCVVAAADMGFIVLMMAPGLVPFWPAALGPVLWLLAWACSAVALLSSRGPPGKAAAAT
jgi:hypothetical protein